jgi:hypothetical protein
MGRYHDVLQAKGVFSTPASFTDIIPPNVVEKQVPTATTEKGGTGSCNQTRLGWIRTDVQYDPICVDVAYDARTGLPATSNTPAGSKYTIRMPKLPDYKPDLAAQLARRYGIGFAVSSPPSSNNNTPPPSSGGGFGISSPGNGATLSSDASVRGTVENGSWRVEFGVGASPSSWTTIGSGSNAVNGGTLAGISVSNLPDGVYSVRIVQGGQTSSSTFNVKKGGGGGTTPPTQPSGGGQTPQDPVPPTAKPSTPVPPTPTESSGGPGPGPGITPQLPATSTPLPRQSP